jgi:hypothetical protein
MMVRLAAQFVARNLTRQLDGGEPPLVHQCPDVAIDRGDPETADFRSGQLQNLAGAEGPVGTLKRSPDCPALPCITFHPSGSFILATAAPEF